MRLVIFALIIYFIYKLFDMEFKSKYFKLEEFENREKIPSKYIKNVSELAKNLDVLREHLGKPIHINSGYRSQSHNAAVGGVQNSQHLTASAADISVKGMSTNQIKQAIENLIDSGKMKQGGVGFYSTWIHYDIRGKKARWNG